MEKSKKEESKTPTPNKGRLDVRVPFEASVSLIASVIGFVIDLIAIYALFQKTELPSTFQTLALLFFSLIIVLLLGLFIYEYQSKRNQRIINDLRKIEITLFSEIEQDIPALIGTGGIDESPAA
jgi:hypothetical protein